MYKNTPQQTTLEMTCYLLDIFQKNVYIFLVWRSNKSNQHFGKVCQISLQYRNTNNDMQCFKSLTCWLIMVTMTFQKHKVLQETLFGEEGITKGLTWSLPGEKKKLERVYAESSAHHLTWSQIWVQTGSKWAEKTKSLSEELGHGCI